MSVISNSNEFCSKKSFYGDFLALFYLFFGSICLIELGIRVRVRAEPKEALSWAELAKIELEDFYWLDSSCVELARWLKPSLPTLNIGAESSARQGAYLG